MTIKKTSHARYETWYHIAWCTKYRKKVFTGTDTKRSVAELLRKIAKEYDMEIDRVEVLTDHVHLLLSAPPRFGYLDISSELWAPG